MAEVVRPIHIADLLGSRLRFFKAPLSEPHLVWHAVDDLHACFSLPRGLRREFRHRLKAEHGKDVRTVATADGIVTIAPHWMAQGFISSMVELGLASRDVEMAYAQRATDAWNVLVGDMPPGASLNLMIQAFRNTNGIPSAETGGPAS